MSRSEMPSRLRMFIELVAVTASLAFPVDCWGDGELTFRFVKQHCGKCHGESMPSGELNLTALRTSTSFDRDREIWERVVEKLKSGEMPPPESPRPDIKEVQAVTRWLESEFLRQDRAIIPQAGKTAPRRLNRVEYSNTIRDLLGVELPIAEDLPTDESAYGFDNNAEALQVSSALLEKYLDAAERAVRTVLFGARPVSPSVTHYPTPVRINTPRGKIELPPDMFHYDESGLSTVHAAHIVHRFPVDGEYSFRVVLNGHRPIQSEPARPALFIDGRLVHEFEIDATDLEGQFVEAKIHVAAGERLISASYLKQYHGLPASYNGPEPSQRTSAPVLSKKATGALTPEDIEILRKFGTKIKTDAIEARVDHRFESIDIGGPFSQQATDYSAAKTKLLGCGHAAGEHSSACARESIGRFARRAFRRPVADTELEPFLQLVTTVQNEGDTFEEGIAAALQAILVSPQFLFRLERDRPVQVGDTSAEISDHELATRMSYFLWSSTPDDELLALADRGELQSRGQLDVQVRRMLRDSKSRALVDQFAGQWLQFKNVDVVRPDIEQFRQFEDSLRRSMRRETELFVQHIVQQDCSLLDLLDADYTFVDERLARFYGIPNVAGPEFRLVDVRNTQRGGGLLSHASILTISSYSTRTSPVVRGKWILETILNSPPPAPPPAVPPLDVSKVGDAVSLRQELEAHRKATACAGCHARLDPLGFGLENFDAIGAWRDQDGKLPIDTSGTLPNGQSFQGHAELKSVLRENRDMMVKGVTEKLLVYALGRGLERFDRPALLKIQEQVAAEKYRLSALVVGIVNSLPFRMRTP